MSERYIVLDLDATLLHTFDNYKALSKLISGDNNLGYLKSRIYNLKLFNPSSNKNYKYYNMWGIYRPFLAEFVEYIIQEFDDIFIWSAGTEKYVNSIVDLIFEPYNYKPKIIFHDTHCEISEDRSEVIKPLNNLFDSSKQIYGSSNKNGPNELNTYIIDDRSDTMSRNITNGILIHPYNLFELPHDPNKDDVKMFIESTREMDNSLKDLIIFFDKHKNTNDIREINKNNIFNEKIEIKKSIHTITKLSPSHNIHL